jgi:hypothetical protein
MLFMKRFALAVALSFMSEGAIAQTPQQPPPASAMPGEESECSLIRGDMSGASMQLSSTEFQSAISSPRIEGLVQTAMIPMATG